MGLGRSAGRPSGGCDEVKEGKVGEEEVDLKSEGRENW